MKFLIYGATKGRGDGMGQTVALALIERGHKVWGVCRDAEKAAKETKFPLQAINLLTEEGQNRIKALIQEIVPDVIWTACGTGFSEPLWTLPMEASDEMIEANIRNNIVFCKTCAPSCLTGGPHLVLTGSVAGVISGSGASVYGGTKAFLTMLARGARKEFQRQGRMSRISVIALPRIRDLGIEAVASTLEFLAGQPRGMELLWD
jgi:NADP-dependent 3-hydroxy acid dehydrogenase YdfG